MALDSTAAAATSADLDQTLAVQERYGAAAQEQEACLCCAVEFDPALLDVIPAEVVERDYGCGNPTRWVSSGDTVLDLGSGSGKNAFICAQIVGAGGRVIGIDRNHDMLDLARGAAPQVAARLGYANVAFREGAIEDLSAPTPDGTPLVADASVDVVLSNCVLNLVNPAARGQLLREIRRVLRPGGRVAISDIVSDREVPLALQHDPDLWSGCISGAWQEDAFLADFRALGFEDVTYADRSDTPWKVVEGISFRSVTLTGALPGGAAARSGCCG
ncbi:methyltransferase domain-containing protein [Synechococcus sp. RSCCF101]|uniref:methyltransferase domain-containing protein n=1 Tax=Synechococcus sp. RSCCF101 TaxID=2511069 RepID=UPI00124619F0|nr:methyltransferase domain-containing protein [Synechococcus sp. RSCCF101]QEY32002.1 methyltransferase domain-containing protein [Synechococcus sp. RSCCF101]